ncbi:heavy metal-associated isoprenylated plant protein 32-like [Zingiber officinale]|uniref:HMA domain-containing protein n=1 Tax=Zingiber officinale TaxID=94328 RepID=A0A8J5KHY5_ZINOF|nr:heavy metal-associated isoprenylated plant protein 32-like [Zingiber officinale]KAG6477347.1 hypothetical protein ZIOFF_066600 [Zingiber officinale]
MSKEANKFLKIQACVLKVNNICCDGCQKKVRRVLLRTEGVYEVTIDGEKRKVTVTGTADPATLIRKLNKAGKHAELWHAKGGGQQKLTDMLQEHKLDHAKGQQKGGGGGGGGKEKKSQKQTQEMGKGFKDLKFPDLKLPFKKDDNRKVKFNLPSQEEVDDGSDYDSDDDDDWEEFDDEDLDDMHDEFGGDGMLGGPKTMNPNLKNFNQFNGKENKAASHKKGGGGKGVNLVQVINKAMGSKNGGDGKQNQASGGGKKGHGTHESKNGGGSNKNAKGGNQGNHGHPSSHGANKHVDGSNTNGFPAGAMPPGYFQPGTMPPEMMMAGGNPYQQQQYLQALMQQQQQQQRMMMMGGAERPAFSPAQLGYGYGRPVYVPQMQPYPQEVPYNMFSDENPNSCSVM